MFCKRDFDVFQVEGLEERMTEIRRFIQPTFQKEQEKLARIVEQAIQKEVYVHIAQHRRRTVHAPENTWSALSTSKRGYKSQPHFQLGIWKDYVFLYLSMIDSPLHKGEMADFLLQEKYIFPNDFVYSVDHTVPTYFSISEDFKKALLRFRETKKGELEIGRVFRREVFLRKEIVTIEKAFEETVRALLPLYKELLAINQS